MFDDITKHQIYLQRHGRGLYRDFLPELNKLRDNVIKSLDSVDLTIMDKKALSAKLLELEALITSSVENSLNLDTFTDLAMYEDEFITKMITNNVAVGTAVVSTGINVEAMQIMLGKSKLTLDGKKPMSIDQTIKQFSKRYYKDIKSYVQLGIAEGLTTDEIVSNIQSLSNNRTRSQAEALVRTLANHVGNVSRENVFSGNDKLWKGERFFATLDNRTSDLCLSASSYNGDGIYKIGEAPKCPRHFSCRSYTLKILKDKYSLDDGTETQSSQFGTVPQKYTYNDFLKRQDAKFQNEVLGVERAKLYRKSGESIDRFVDKSGKYLTLDELKKLEL